jgi:hypothetical protein
VEKNKNNNQIRPTFSADCRVATTTTRVPAYASSVYPTSLPSAMMAAKAFFQIGDDDDKKVEEKEDDIWDPFSADCRVEEMMSKGRSEGRRKTSRCPYCAFGFHCKFRGMRSLKLCHSCQIM